MVKTEIAIGDIVTTGWDGLWEVVKLHSDPSHLYCKKLSGNDESVFKVGTTHPIHIKFIRRVAKNDCNFKRRKISLKYVRS